MSKVYMLRQDLGAVDEGQRDIAAFVSEDVAYEAMLLAEELTGDTDRYYVKDYAVYDVATTWLLVSNGLGR